MSDYGLKWADLPDYSALASIATRWSRRWCWANTKSVFERTLAVPLLVTAEQHKRLTYNLQAIADASAAALTHSLNGWTNGAFKPAVGKEKTAGFKLNWPDNFSSDFMDPLMISLRQRGVGETSTEWLALERGAAHAIGICQARVHKGEAPRLPHSGALPAGVSVRLGAGRVYARAIEVSGADVVLGDLGACRLGSVPASTLPLEACEYVEVAHWDQTWHVRFVFVRMKTEEEIAAAKSRRKGVVRVDPVTPPAPLPPVAPSAHPAALPGKPANASKPKVAVEASGGSTASQKPADKYRLAVPAPPVAPVSDLTEEERWDQEAREMYPHLAAGVANQIEMRRAAGEIEAPERLVYAFLANGQNIRGRDGTDYRFAKSYAPRAPVAPAADLDEPRSALAELLATKVPD